MRRDVSERSEPAGGDLAVDPTRDHSGDASADHKEHEPRGRGRLGLVVLGVLLVAVLAAYVLSAVSYLQGLDQQYEPPGTRADGVSVSLVPFAVDAIDQVVSTEVLIYPGEDLLTPDKRLIDDLTVDVFATESQTLTFDKGTIPTPAKVVIPAIGVVQRYPFDAYRFTAAVRVTKRKTGAVRSTPNVVPTDVSVFFAVPGWDFDTLLSTSGFQPEERPILGEITRDGSTRMIAVMFILLIIMFGVLAVMVVLAGRWGAVPFTIGTAAWMTGALFALVTLRNGLPGTPPLGSVMDVLAYFWVIATIMIAIGVTVVTLVVSPGSHRPDTSR